MVRTPKLARGVQADRLKPTNLVFPSETARAAWFFDFLGADLATLTPGQEIGHRRDAIGFAGGWPESDADIDATDNLPTLTTLTRLQARIKAGIETLTRGDWWMLDQPIMFGIAKFGLRESRIIRGERRGTFSALFVAAAMDLTQEHWREIRRCQCGTMFLRSGKQQYCKPSCSQKNRWDRYKAGRPERDYRAERERAARRRTYPKVKLGRRRSS